MQQIYLNKLKTWRPGLLLAGLLALALLHPLRVAAEGGPSATDGGTAEIGTVGGSHNNQSTGPLISEDPYVGWYGGTATPGR